MAAQARRLSQLQLYRRWRGAAGPEMAGRVAAAPFTTLSRLSWPDSDEPPASYEQAEEVAAFLAQSAEGQRVNAGYAAYFIDLPAALSVGIGAFLQTEGIAPVSVIGASYHPGAVIDGTDTREALAFYGSHLGGYSHEKGFAFLLEAERLPFPVTDNLQLITSFDNRYGLHASFFPSFEEMQERGILELIDVRLAQAETLPDMEVFYQGAIEAGLLVRRVLLNITL